MNAIVQRHTIKSAPISPETDGLMRKLSSRVQDVPGALRTFQIAEHVAPSADERQTIQSRRQQVANGLEPVGPKPSDDAAERITRAIVALKLAFPKSATGEAGAKALVSLYISALRTYPEWAITEACRRFLDGRAGKGSYAPTPPELARECASLVTPLYEEQAALDRILLANTYREIGQEERERVNRGFNDLMRSMGRATDMRKPQWERMALERKDRSAEAVAQDDAELARLEAEAREYRPPISPELASRLAPHVEENRIVAEAKREREATRERAA